MEATDPSLLPGPADRCNMIATQIPSQSIPPSAQPVPLCPVPSRPRLTVCVCVCLNPSPRQDEPGTGEGFKFATLPVLHILSLPILSLPIPHACPTAAGVSLPAGRGTGTGKLITMGFAHGARKVGPQ